MPIATVLTANPSTTKVRLACPTTTSASANCDRDGFGEIVTIISGTRYEGVGTRLDDPEASYYRSWGCDYTSGVDKQVVTMDIRGGNDDTGGPITAEIKHYYYGFFTASVVEGASLLSEGGTAAIAAPSSTGSASSSSPRTADSGSATQTSGTTPAATGSAPATASTGAAARFPVGQSALFALAGAAWSMWSIG